MKGRMGTPTYMAPELWVKHMQYTSAVDMWAIGVTAYLLLCGTRPFHHRDIDVKVCAAQSRLFISAIYLGWSEGRQRADDADHDSSGYSARDSEIAPGRGRPRPTGLRRVACATLSGPHPPRAPTTRSPTGSARSLICEARVVIDSASYFGYL